MAKAAKKPARKVGASTGGVGNRGKGRPKGSLNKVTGDLRSMILNALDKAGGVDYLQTQATENPASFLTLIGKILPKEVTGADGKDLFPTSIKIELVQPRPK